MSSILLKHFVSPLKTKEILIQSGYDKKIDKPTLDLIGNHIAEAHKNYDIAHKSEATFRDEVLHKTIIWQCADIVAKVLFPDTTKLYTNAYKPEPDPYEHKCFFAFNNEQFKEGKQKAKIEEEEKIYSAGAGLYGTKEGIRDFFACYDAKGKKIKEICDPQDVYDYEHSNHECSYVGDDEEAIKIVVAYFGEEIAKTVVRRYGYVDIDELNFK